MPDEYGDFHKHINQARRWSRRTNRSTIPGYFLRQQTTQSLSVGGVAGDLSHLDVTPFFSQFDQA
jgi:hypothetical protein